MWLMVALFVWFLRAAQAPRLALENLALRQQLHHLEQRSERPPLKPSERNFWVALSKALAGWRSPLVIVKPATVVAWTTANGAARRADATDAVLTAGWPTSCKSRASPSPTGHRTRLLTSNAATAHCDRKRGATSSSLSERHTLPVCREFVRYYYGAVWGRDEGLEDLLGQKTVEAVRDKDERTAADSAPRRKAEHLSGTGRVHSPGTPPRHRQQLGYDLVVNTESLSPETAAEAVHSALRSKLGGEF